MLAGAPFALVDLLSVRLVMTLLRVVETLATLSLTTGIDVRVLFGELVSVDADLLETVPKRMPQWTARKPATDIFAACRGFKMIGVDAPPMDAVVVGMGANKGVVTKVIKDRTAWVTVFPRVRHAVGAVCTTNLSFFSRRDIERPIAIETKNRTLPYLASGLGVWFWNVRIEKSSEFRRSIRDGEKRYG